VITLRRALLLLALAAGPAAAQRAEPASNCGVCHGKEAREFRDSIHVRGGLTCIACHGGSPDAMDPAGAHGDDLDPLRDRRTAVESCGSCHADVGRMRTFGLRTDQLSLYRTSQHGMKLAEDGDAAVATCTSCHGAHDVLSAKNPLSPVSPARQVQTCGSCHADAELMGGYGIPADTVAKYRESVHGQALIEQGSSAAPACTDCHGSHGALPPRFDDVGEVCGHCHSTVEAFFAESPHATTRGASVQCVSCHSNHDVRRPSAAMFEGEDEGHCGSCHSPGDAGMLVASALHEDLDELATTIADAESAVRSAGGRGLFLGAERGYLDEARGLLVRSRTMTHSLSPEALDDILNRGHGMVGQTMEGLATKNRIFRDRKIYTGIFLGISLAFAIVLWMYGGALRARGTRRREVPLP